MKKFVIFLLVLLFIPLTGCQAVQTYKNDDGKIIIGFISESMTVQRWLRDRDIFVARAKELGAEVIVLNAYEDSTRQKEIGIELVDRGVDVLVIVAYDKDTLGELIKYSHNNNVKVIAYDRLITNSKADLYISFDNYQVGYLMATAATAAIPSGNYLILNGPSTDNNCFMINDGFMDVLQPLIDGGEVQIMGETWIEAWRDEAAYEFVAGIIAEGVRIDAILAANDRLAEGAVNALSENRLARDVYVTGQDAELAACQRIVEGTQHMTVYKPIRQLAEGAAEIAVKMTLGEDIGSRDTIFDGTYDIPYIIYAPKSVTRDNIMDTVIKDGFYTIEQVFMNVPQSQWPQ
jgi:D-xylose transport system substrate-binding protein